MKTFLLVLSCVFTFVQIFTMEMLAADIPAKKVPAASEKLFQGKFDRSSTTGKNRWSVTKHVFSMKKVPNASEILKGVLARGEKDCFRLTIDKKSANFLQPDGKRKYEVECGLIKNFPLRPDMAGKTLYASIQYTGKGIFQLFVNIPGKGTFRGMDLRRSGIIKAQVKIPAGVKALSVNFWLRGEGDIKVLSGEISVR